MTTDNNEVSIIKGLLKDHLRSIGIVSIADRTKGFKRYYTLLLLAVAAYLYFYKDMNIAVFAVPIIPLIVFWLLYIVDLNIMIQCLVKIQKILIEEHSILLDMNQLLDILQEYAKENDFF